MANERSELVRKVVGVYRNWYGAAVCSDEAWKKKVAAIQAMINDCEIVLPVPRMDLNESRPRFDIPEGNPLDMEPMYKSVPVGSNQARYAGRVAQMLVEAGHIVFYINHSLAVSKQYGGDDLMVRDILTKAPVIVYFKNKDGRNNGWVESALLSREYGIAIEVQEVN